MPKVKFINEIISVDVPQGAILRDVAIAQGIEIYRGMWTHINCRGMGICGRCRIWVLSNKSNVSKPSLIRERLVHRVKGDLRLACQVRITGDVEIKTRPLGPAVIKAVGPQRPASYKEVAEQRYIDALAAQKADALKKAEAAKKKKEEEALKAAEEAKTAKTVEAAEVTDPPPEAKEGDAAAPQTSGSAKEVPESGQSKDAKPAGDPATPQ